MRCSTAYGSCRSRRNRRDFDSNIGISGKHLQTYSDERPLSLNGWVSCYSKNDYGGPAEGHRCGRVSKGCRRAARSQGLPGSQAATLQDSCRSAEAEESEVTPSNSN